MLLAYAFKKRKINFSDNEVRFFDNIIDVLGLRFYRNFMTIAIVFVAILWQFCGKNNRFYCEFMAKTIDSIAILWRMQPILLPFHGDFRAKKIYFVEIIWR